MVDPKSPNVTDFFPWPQGSGFRGSQAWWRSILTLDEQSRLDMLLGLALLNPELEQRLLQHDESILTPFHFSEDTCNRLLEIQAGSLVEFAQVWIIECNK